jgi:ParB family transcriptional regulator, chromosome partitioning protein
VSEGVAGAGRRRASAKLAGAATLLAHDGEEEPGGDDAAVRPAGGPVGTGDAAPPVPSMPPAFIGLTAAKAFNESVADYASRLEAELAAAEAEIARLRGAGDSAASEAEAARDAAAAGLERVRRLAERAGDAVDEFYLLDPAVVADPLPADRLAVAFDDDEFRELRESIRQHGQDTPITVRPGPANEAFEIAAGRRRLEACRQLGVPVLARVRSLDDRAMLRAQHDENERRRDVSAFERARWFAAVRDRLGLAVADLAREFGVDLSTMSTYLRIARLPRPLTEALSDPRVLSVHRSRQLLVALDRDEAALGRGLAALARHHEEAAERGVRPGPEAEFAVVVAAMEGREPAARLQRRTIVDRRGRVLATVVRSGQQWIFRMASGVEEGFVAFVADRLPALRQDFASERGSPDAVSEERDGRSAAPSASPG